MSSFALVSSADIFGIIDVKKYRSKETGLGICFAHVDGPLVNGYFCLGRNIFTYIFNSYLRKEPFGGGSKFIALLGLCKISRTETVTLCFCFRWNFKK